MEPGGRQAIGAGEPALIAFASRVRASQLAESSPVRQNTDTSCSTILFFNDHDFSWALRRSNAGVHHHSTFIV